MARREGLYLDDLKKFVVAEIPLRKGWGRPTM